MKVLRISILLFLLPITFLFATELEVHFVDVGQGSGVILQTSDAVVVVDAGQYGEMADYLRGIGVTDIDLIIGSHAHADHIGGFPAIFENHEIATVWYNGQTHTTRTFENFIDAILNSDADYYEPGIGDSVSYGDLEIHVLHPEGSASDYSGHLHDKNIVIHAVYGEVSFLLTGDAEVKSEDEILDSGLDIQSTVLKLGHHGSRTSSSVDFLRAVAPQFAVYQAGIDNRYGHPHAEVIDRVQQNTSADIFGSDIHGTIIFRTDGKSITVETEQSATIQRESVVDRVNINTATVEELQQIVHIGEARAEEIMRLRPFSSVSQLSRVSGIGAGRLQDIIDQGLASVD
ncbi:MBL fold metallo-hydrolase [Spirochaeta africana]|uniref:Putative hydrolase (Metallo-beta-lactamase superfamily) n=1 Tax=Spirochaeta africana (strain ATCC 700263 / DSM 8902 / Z-7692) TaxID=889378 RepID=H9UIU5_SPIAZ|nr:MBL fold metallo-hydrolase [Spirochaeta africana]AFG37438.1 putative hydrolase (metallo-beta-lactamase superfamily) [Spirochaeta africana DSM 8902]